MFRIGDHVEHQQTGQVGQVMGFGHQIVNHVYLPTLKVWLTEQTQQSIGVIEDVSSTWVLMTTDAS